MAGSDNIDGPVHSATGLDVRARTTPHNDLATLPPYRNRANITTYHRKGFRRIFAYNVKCEDFVRVAASVPAYVLTILLIMSMILMAAMLIDLNVDLNTTDLSEYYQLIEYQSKCYDRIPRAPTDAVANIKYSHNFAQDKRKIQSMKEIAIIRSQIAELKERHNELITKVMHHQFSSIAQITVEELQKESIEEVVRHQIDIYDEKKLGSVDFASESMGGYIVSTPDTIPFKNPPPLYMLNMIPVGRSNSRGSSNNIIKSSMLPGDCWAFKGPVGKILIQLPVAIYVEAVTLGHVSSKSVPSGRIDSAPKEFYIYGASSDDDESHLTKLGKFTYNTDGKPRQTFTFRPSLDVPFSRIMLSIISNHGNKEYTCVYKFEVHGKIASENNNTVF